MRMKPGEAQLWFSLLLLASRYLEWGTGGSTVLAAWRSLQTSLPPLQIDSVDSSENWFGQLRTRNPVVASAEAAGKLHFHLGDVGETGAWGIPTNFGGRPTAVRQQQARSYVQSVGAGR